MLIFFFLSEIIASKLNTRLFIIFLKEMYKYLKYSMACRNLKNIFLRFKVQNTSNVDNIKYVNKKERYKLFCRNSKIIIHKKLKLFSSIRT